MNKTSVLIWLGMRLLGVRIGSDWFGTVQNGSDDEKTRQRQRQTMRQTETRSVREAKKAEVLVSVIDRYLVLLTETVTVK